METVVLLKHIMEILEKEFPTSLSETWDNVGLLVGRNDSEINKIQISLDLTDNVIENAIKNNVDLIITHHPFIFSSIKKINNNSLIGNKIIKLIKNNISVYTLHTNLDSAKTGLNNYIVKKLGITDSKIIEEKISTEFKLSISLSENSYLKIKKLLKDKCLKYRNYKLMDVDKEEEFRVDILGTKNQLYSFLNQIKNDYPVEDNNYEIVKLENNYYTQEGIGRYFNLETETTIDQYIKHIKDKLDIKNVRLVGNESEKVKKVAVVNGSGMSFFKKLSKLKIDLFLTGDIKYHEALDSYEMGINLLDIGHYESEIFFSDLIINSLKQISKIEIINYNNEKIFKYK